MKILIQNEKCTGCRLCEQVCTITHFKEINPRKAAIKISAEFPRPGIYKPIICDQCGTCIEVCPMDAIYKDDDAIKINQELCSGCQICVTECPIGAIRVHDGLDVPIICDLCMECTEICNTSALTGSE